MAAYEEGFIHVMLLAVRNSEVSKLLQMRDGGRLLLMTTRTFSPVRLVTSRWVPQPPFYLHLIFGSTAPHSLVRIQLLLPDWPLTSPPPGWTPSSDPDSGTTVNVSHNSLFCPSHCYSASEMRPYYFVLSIKVHVLALWIHLILDYIFSLI